MTPLPSLSIPTYDVCGVKIAALHPQAAAQTLVDAAIRRIGLEVHLCNAYTLSLVNRDERLLHALRRAHLNVADGAPVAWFGRRHGMHGPVRGPSLVADVARHGLGVGLRHYLYGGGPGVAEKMAYRLRETTPGIHIVGIETPPYRELEHHEVRALGNRLANAGAHVVWVGLGTPRQDYLVPRLAEETDATIIPVGAAFDFFAGTLHQAPPWLHGSGLEWLYRLCREPRRLWRRYLIGNPKFLIQAVRARTQA